MNRTDRQCLQLPTKSSLWKFLTQVWTWNIIIHTSSNVATAYSIICWRIPESCSSFHYLNIIIRTSIFILYSLLSKLKILLTEFHLLDLPSWLVRVAQLCDFNTLIINFIVFSLFRFWYAELRMQYVRVWLIEVSFFRVH